MCRFWQNKQATVTGQTGLHSRRAYDACNGQTTLAPSLIWHQEGLNPLPPDLNVPVIHLLAGNTLWCCQKIWGKYARQESQNGICHLRGDFRDKTWKGNPVFVSAAIWLKYLWLLLWERGDRCINRWGYRDESRFPFVIFSSLWESRNASEWKVQKSQKAKFYSVPGLFWQMHGHQFGP